ncbi:MAG: hypothetical protein FJW90_04495 [Actinobacteria bacterium]|nr:hypothetical protein [Actinomycetota bacterium]
MVVSIVALIFAVAGTSVASVATISALSKKEKKQTRKIAKNEVNKAAPGLSVLSATTSGNSDQLGGLSLRGLSQWVLVNSAGAVIDSSGGVTATDLAIGRYRVSFPSSVASCGLNANAGTASPASDATPFSDRFVMLGRSTTGANDVQVKVADETGTASNNPFFLTVQC